MKRILTKKECEEHPDIAIGPLEGAYLIVGSRCTTIWSEMYGKPVRTVKAAGFHVLDWMVVDIGSSMEDYETLPKGYSKERHQEIYESKIPKCTCGATIAKSPIHSDWCDKEEII